MTRLSGSAAIVGPSGPPDPTRPADLRAHLEDRLWDTVLGRGINPWRHGAAMLAEAVGGADAAVMLEGVWALEGVYASVLADAADPRRFRLPEGPAERAAAAPCVLLEVAHDPDGPGGGAHRGDDLVAWSLRAGSRRVWRWTGACAYLGELRPDAAGVTRLFQDPHAWLRRLVTAAAYDARARRWRQEAVAGALRRGEGPAGRARAWDQAAQVHAVERRTPDGALVLDPAAIPWTRAGVLAEAEAVEIVDAPVDGPLGRALQGLNPRLGTARGIPLRGLEAARAPRRGAAQGQGRRAA